MTYKEFWLKLFNENDIALTCAIILINRFTNEEQLKSGLDFILKERKHLNEIVSEEIVKNTFK